MGKLNGWEIILIVAAILLLFGGRKIPELMKGVGRGIREFKDGMNNPDAGETKKTEPKETEKH